MQRNRRTSSALVLAISLAGCTGQVGIDGDEPGAKDAHLVAGSTYSSLRDLENLFPIPASSQNIEVGTFDAAAGTFTGLVTTTSYQINPITHKPYPVQHPPIANISAVKATLVFRVLSRGNANFYVTVDGRTISAPAGATSIAVDVARSTMSQWTIGVGSATYSDRLIIGRPGVLGAGVFTIGALPISLLYEPPQTGAGLSSTTITTSQTVGSSITAGQTTENSTSKPSFVGVSDYIDKLSQLKAALALTPISIPAMNYTIDLVKGALGTTTSDTTTGTSVSTENTLEISATDSLTYSTNAGLGPGRGDRIIYLRDAQLAWVMIDGEISFALIGYGARAAYTVEQLKLDRTSLMSGVGVANTVSQLDADTLDALLGLDPFVSFRRIPLPGPLGGGPVLSPPRYVDKGIEEGDGPAAFVQQETVTTTDRTANKSFNATTVEYHAGWLGTLGLGSESQTTKVSTTVSSLRSESVSTQVTATLNIAANVGNPYRLHVYYDAVFSTFAVRNDSDTPIVVGPPVAF